MYVKKANQFKAIRYFLKLENNFWIIFNNNIVKLPFYKCYKFDSWFFFSILNTNDFYPKNILNNFILASVLGIYYIKIIFYIKSDNYS